MAGGGTSEKLCLKPDMKQQEHATLESPKPSVGSDKMFRGPT